MVSKIELTADIENISTDIRGLYCMIVPQIRIHYSNYVSDQLIFKTLMRFLCLRDSEFRGNHKNLQMFCAKDHSLGFQDLFILLTYEVV